MLYRDDVGVILFKWEMQVESADVEIWDETWIRKEGLYFHRLMGKMLDEIMYRAVFIKCNQALKSIPYNFNMSNCLLLACY